MTAHNTGASAAIIATTSAIILADEKRQKIVTAYSDDYAEIDTTCSLGWQGWLVVLIVPVSIFGSITAPLWVEWIRNF